MYDVIKLIFILFCFLFVGCKHAQPEETSNIKLRFLDEYVLSNKLMVDSTLVGGLSGIDFYNGQYYLACDDSKNPRFYKASIKISNYGFDTIEVNSVVPLYNYKNVLDLESIVVDTVSKNVLLVSEGKIKNGFNPSFLSVNQQGEFISEFKIPQYFKAKGSQKPRDNGVFEGLTQSFNHDGYWVATELPLKEDGPKPKFTPTTSPVRFTFFDKEGNANQQFAYLLNSIGKNPYKGFGVNGVTDILAYAPTKLFVIERSYSSGYGNLGNVIKLYSVDYNEAVNTISIHKLKRSNYKPIYKELLFDFASIQEKLTNQSIDNIEGLCFGPVLPNGNKSIILVADNNFNKDNDQINQFILMEILD